MSYEPAKGGGKGSRAGGGKELTDKETRREARAQAKGAREAARGRELLRAGDYIRLRAVAPPRQVKTEPESEDSPAWGLNHVCVYRTIANRAREREAGQEEEPERRGRGHQSRHRGSRPFRGGARAGHIGA